MNRPFDLKLMKADADRETRIKEARDGLADARTEIHVFGLPKVEQDLAWPEGPPVPLQTLHERVRRLERTLESLGAVADEPKAVTCRCGYNGTGAHPCHFNGYTCRQPATSRFIATPGTSLAGMQPKAGAYKTFACDACWAKYKAMMAAGDA